jgi:hypothetical protein
MILGTIVSISLILQCMAVYYSFRLITTTEHTRAWLLLSLGIATMAARRIITLAAFLSTLSTHRLIDYSSEIIGVMGSAMMLVGVLSIKPVFILVKKAEEEQRVLAASLQEALDHIKTLKELLPICVNCKKIRDDEGYWQQIDTYLTKNSGTQFSHGICPSCCKELYPAQYTKMFPE